MIAFLVAFTLSTSSPVVSAVSAAPRDSAAAVVPAGDPAARLQAGEASRRTRHRTRLLARTRFDGLRRRGERLRFPGGEGGWPDAASRRLATPSPSLVAIRAGGARLRRAVAAEARGDGGEESDPDPASRVLELARGARPHRPLPDPFRELA